MAFGLRRYAALLGARGDHRAVVRVLGTASSAPDTAGTLLVAGPSAEKDLLATARRALTKEEFASAWAEGRSLTLEDAVARALALSHFNPNTTG
jgi:hypothetical protein